MTRDLQFGLMLTSAMAVALLPRALPSLETAERYLSPQVASALNDTSTPEVLVPGAGAHVPIANSPLTTVVPDAYAPPAPSSDPTRSRDEESQLFVPKSVTMPDAFPSLDEPPKLEPPVPERSKDGPIPFPVPLVIDGSDEAGRPEPEPERLPTFPPATEPRHEQNDTEATPDEKTIDESELVLPKPVLTSRAEPPPSEVSSARSKPSVRSFEIKSTQTSAGETLPPPIHPYFQRFRDRGEYFVRTGDTLESIAHRLYGNPEHAKALLSANRERLPGPEDLKPGMRLVVP